MGKAKPSPNFVRDYRLRFPMNGARISVAQGMAYWSGVKKDLPPRDLLDEWHTLLTQYPPDGVVPFVTEQNDLRLREIEAWRIEHDHLEDETLRWLNMPLNAEGPT